MTAPAGRRVSLGDAEREELERAAEANFTASWWLLGEVVGAELDDRDGIRTVVSGAPEPLLNGVVSARIERDVDGAIDRVLHRFRDAGVPFVWWVGPSTGPADLPRRLEALGFAPWGSSWPGMAVRLTQVAAPAAPDGLEIRVVDDEVRLRDYVDVFGAVLSPSAAFTDAMEAVGRARLAGREVPVVDFIGYLNGAPVATSTLIDAGGAAGIYNVATVESARRQGIGTALTFAALSVGIERGRSIGVLEASRLGYAVYQRLGFREVTRFSPYRRVA